MVRASRVEFCCLVSEVQCERQEKETNNCRRWICLGRSADQLGILLDLHRVHVRRTLRHHLGRCTAADRGHYGRTAVWLPQDHCRRVGRDCVPLADRRLGVDQA